MIAVFDASSLISMSQTCLVNSLKELREQTNSTFAVPESVFIEIVERPLQIKRFELNAIRLRKAIEEQWLQVKRLDPRHDELAKEIEGKANSLLYIKGKPIKLIQRGEAEALALTKQLNSNVLVIDERTTRAIIEAPLQLKQLMEARRNEKITLDEKNSRALRQMFAGLNIVRSVELVALAFERNMLAGDLPKGRQALEAALYAVKYAGCAVSGFEIEQFMAGLRI